MNDIRSRGEDSVYDLLAIGCGPFNLGLAALASTTPEVRLLALESTPELRWHPGVMFDDATLQVSFLADLVTLIDPTHSLSFLAYLRDVDRMYPFYVRERFHLTRREYEMYLRWAAGKLPALRFSHHVDRVLWDGDDGCFHVQATVGKRSRRLFRARHLALGIGTEPHVPPCLSDLPPQRLLHSGAYLPRKGDLQHARRVTVVGSGQSGAEVVLDLLRTGDAGPALAWFTRTASFAPLDYTKLVLEMTTPAYVRYFHGLSAERRDQLVRAQWHHYKGISSDTLDEIHDQLYRRALSEDQPPVTLRCGVAVEAAVAHDEGVELSCRHLDSGRTFIHDTDLVIAATGYKHRPHAFLRAVEPLLRREHGGRLCIRLDHSIETDPAISGRIFVANADLYSHGVAAPDLGIGAYRNATILNTVAGRELYRLPQHTAFTQFELPHPVRRNNDQVHAPAIVGEVLGSPRQERPR